MRQLFLTALAVIVSALPPASAWGQAEIPWGVVGSGGAHLGGPSHSLRGTLGQTAIGVVAGPSNAHEIGFWYYPLEDVTDIADDASQGTIQNWLGQNHPNPFNPLTTLQFSVAERSHVSIRIYDVTGREVRTVVDETLAPGQYQRTLDAEGLASGMYFCRMVCGGFAETRKLVLLK